MHQSPINLIITWRTDLPLAGNIRCAIACMGTDTCMSDHALSVMTSLSHGHEQQQQHLHAW